MKQPYSNEDSGSQVDAYPLSPMQEGMLFHHLKEPHSGIDIEQLVIRLPEIVDVRRLEAAWQWLVRRHAVLRTRFAWEEVDRPRQEILSAAPVPFMVEDARALSRPEQRERLRSFLQTDRLRGFEMNCAPMARLTLFQWDEASSTLVWTFHHALLDGRCFPILLQEVFEAYSELAMGAVAPRPTPPPYRRYIDWLQGQSFADAETFWKELLAGFAAPTPLVVDRLGPADEQPHRQGEAWEQLDSAGTVRLRQLAEGHGLTVNSIVMGAWAILLHRYSGEADIVFGATRACRKSSVPEADATIGVFINTVPVRVKLKSDDSALSVFQAVRQQWLAVRPWEHTPLVRIKSFSQVPQNQPLFETLVVFENVRLDTAMRSSGGAWTSRQVELHELTSFPITLAAYDGEELSFKIEYDRRRLDDASIARMLGHLRRLLEHAIAEPDLPLGALALLDQEEIRQVLAFARGEKVDYSRFQCLHHGFEQQASLTPDAPAVWLEERSLTYRELDRRANQLAHFLRASGVKSDTLVGVCMERSLEMVIALYGILKAGGAYVPIDPEYPRDRVAFMLGDAGVPVLLSQRHLVDGLPDHQARLICLDSDWAEIAKQSEARPVNLVSADDLAYLIYTSGSTGMPKGAMNTHRGIVNRLLWMQDQYRLGNQDVVLQKTPFSFDVSVWEFFWPLLAGAGLLLARPGGHKDPGYLVELIQKRSVSVLHFVPPMLRAFLEEPGVEQCRTLRHVICSGEALPFDLQQKCLGRLPAELHNLYGPTEAAVDVTHWTCLRNSSVNLVPIGRPVANTQIYILDSRLQLVPLGVPGELHIGGVQVGRGYLGRPDLTAEKFIPDPFSSQSGARLYKTGDLCRCLADGTIEYLDRMDFQVKIRGFRIELGEIEARLGDHSAVRQAVTVVRTDGPGEKQLVAYMVPSGTAKPVAGELRDHLLEKLPEFMVPSAFVWLASLPLSPNGKLDRKALPAPEVDRTARVASFEPPQTPTESVLAEIWAKVLKVERVGRADNFFELGGDSILTIQIVSLARQAGLVLSPKLLYQHPAVGELAARVTSAAGHPTAEQGLVQGMAPLTPIQHWFFEQELAEPHHYNQAFLFSVNEPLEIEPLARALAQLERHHDALRLRMAAPGHPRVQTFAAPSAAVPFERVDLSDVGENELASRIESVAGRAQATLDFTQGPLWRAVYFDLGREHAGRLLLAIHHLAVDGVSWRVLIEDLEQAYGAERTGQPVRLPPKTTSVKEWAARLTDLVNRGEVPGGALPWQSLLSDVTGALPVELRSGENTEASTRTVTVRLSAVETEALLQQAPSAYRTQINDLLLAALGSTLAEWAGTESLLINLEGHGREDLFEGVDLSRTVGWFTTIYPVRLHISAVGTTAELIKSVKEQLRSVPARGIGFGLLRYLAVDQRLSSAPEPQILFNYLGQFDQVVSASRLFGFAREPVGPWHSPLARRRHLLEVNCLVVNGQLELGWTYSQNRHRAQTIEQLAQRCLARLVELIQQCTTPGVRGATPSDFPLVSIDQGSLDELLQRVPDLEDVYPLSPIQTLFYTAAGRDGRAVLDQWHGTLTGPLDMIAFERAWALVFERHSVLRTSFHAAGLPEPLQVVHRSVALPWRVADWSARTLSEQTALWVELLSTDHAQGMALDHAPLSRLTVVDLGGDRHKFLWSVPALLLDGWSWPRVFSELSLVYEALCRRESPACDSARPYRNYIEWLRRQSCPATEQFWRSFLSGVSEPTPLVAESSDASYPNGDHYARWAGVVEKQIAQHLVTRARQLQVTTNSLIQAAWALVLSRLSGRDDVVFGSAFAGRPTDLEGSEGIIGPFVNNLPVRVSLERTMSVRDFLREVHGQLLRVNEHQFTPLAQIQSWTGVPWRQRLFESILVVQNYLVDESARRLGSAIGISDFVGPIHSSFPLLILVEPESAWRLTLIHDRRELSVAAVDRWGSDLLRVLAAFSDNLDSPLGSLLGLLSEPVRPRPAKPRWRALALNHVPPQTDLERRLARIWEELLQLDGISVEENIFDLGAHSVLVVRLHQRLCESLGRVFPLVAMFQYPSIQSLARFLSRDESTDQSGVQFRIRAQRQREAMGRVRSRANQRSQ